MTDPIIARDDILAVPELPIGSADRAPLALFQGQKPDYPTWAQAALAHLPRRSYTMVDNVAIETLQWGEVGHKGVLLLHGNGAHADWWGFLAPLLAGSGQHVVAISWSGMGGSGWRDTYRMADFVREICGVCGQTGLTQAHRAPVLVGHSFGGFPAMMACLEHPELFSGLIMLDSGIEPPGEEWTGPAKRTAPNRVYGSLDEALARFRLSPPQDCDNLWAIDHIARTSLQEVDGGWSWKFDPYLWNHFDFQPISHLTHNLSVPTYVMRGAKSWLMADRIMNYMRTILPPTAAFSTIHEANHHVMLDQPLATLAAIETALAGFAVLPKTRGKG